MSLVSTFTLSSLELTRFFFAIVLLLFTAHSFGFLFYESKLLRVIGEIFGGLVLTAVVTSLVAGFWFSQVKKKGWRLFWGPRP